MLGAARVKMHMEDAYGNVCVHIEGPGCAHKRGAGYVIESDSNGHFSTLLCMNECKPKRWLQCGLFAAVKAELNEHRH